MAYFARFYHMSLTEVMRMDAELFKRFNQYIQPISAKEKLNLMDVSAYPHLKGAESKNKMRRDLIKVARPRELDGQKNIMTFDEFAEKGLNSGR